MNRVSVTNESECLQAFERGDESALSYLLKVYYPGLCYFAERKVRIKSVAEDIVEEAFIKLWSRRPHFESLSSIKAFLYVIIRNACYNYIKKVKQDKHHYDQFQYLNSGSEDHIEIVRAEVLSAIYNAIETLPDQCQRIFKMSYIDGMKNEQIADNLMLSVQTVKNQKVRAVRLLQLEFKGKEHLLNLIMAGLIFLQ
jgi:RNA polymerase sigma-70 factor (ECF subfamily)